MRKNKTLHHIGNRILSAALLGVLLAGELFGAFSVQAQAAPSGMGSTGKKYEAVFVSEEDLAKAVTVEAVEGSSLSGLVSSLSDYLGAEAENAVGVKFTVSDGKSYKKVQTELSGVQANDKMHLYKQDGKTWSEREFSVAKDGAVWSYFDLPGTYVFTDTGMAAPGDGVTVLDGEDVTVLGEDNDVTVLEDGVDAASADAAFLDVGISAQSDDATVHADHVPVTDLSVPAYAALYADGYMVFQRGDDFSEMVAAHGEIVGGPWTGFETGYYSYNNVPWGGYFVKTARIVCFLDKIQPRYTSNWFYGNGGSSLQQVVGGSNLDLSICMQTDSMFNSCIDLISIDDASLWDLSNVDTASKMFYHCYDLSGVLDVSNWGMDSCGNFSSMFCDCRSVNGIKGINQWNLAGGEYTDLSYKFNKLAFQFMFDGVTCDLDLSGLSFPNMHVNMLRSSNAYSGGFDEDVIDFLDLSNTKIIGSSTSFVGSINSMYAAVAKNPLLIANAKYVDLFNFSAGGFINNGLMLGGGGPQYDTKWLRRIRIGSDKKMANGNWYFIKNSLDNCYGVYLWYSETTKEYYTSQEIFDRHNDNIIDDVYSPVYDLILMKDGTIYAGKAPSEIENMEDIVGMIAYNNVTYNGNPGKGAYLKSYISEISDSVVLKFSGVLHPYSRYIADFNSSGDVIDRIVADFSEYTGVFDASRKYQVYISSSTKKFHVNQFILNDKILEGDRSVFYNLFSEFADPDVKYKRAGCDTVFTLTDLFFSDDVISGTYSCLENIYFDPVMPKAGGIQKITDGYLEMIPDKLPEPEIISTGWKFTGWFTESEGGTQLKPGDKITQTTYYAHWQDYTYDLVLKPNGADGEDIRQAGLEYHKAHKLPGAVYQYEGKVFKGWNTRKNGSGTHYEPNDYVTGLTEVDGGTVTLYAEWEDEPEYVTITFISNIEGMPVPDPIQVEKGKDFSGDRLPKLVYDGYTLWNWEFEFNGSWYTSTSIAGSNLKQDRVVRYNWYKNPTITFHASPEAEDMVIVIPYYSKLSVGQIPSYPQTADRTVRMMGWYKDEALTNAGVDVTSAITKDTHYYAKWGYKPVWNANGGQITSDLSMYGYQAGSQYMIESLPEVYFTGRILDGWFLEDGTEVHAGDTVDLMVFPKITAKWTQREMVTITFDKNGAYNCSGNLMPVVYKGDPVEFPVIVQGPRSYVSGGYRYAPFLGWADADGNFHQSGEVFLEDTTLTAQFGTLDCTLTFDSQGGSTPAGLNVSSSKIVVASGSTLSNLPGSKKEQYILDGWYSEPGGAGTKLTTETVVTESGTWYANWKPFLVSEVGDTSYYTFGAEWSNASNTSVTNVDDRLDWHVSSTSSVSSSLHLWFELSKDAVADGKVIPVGAVKIRIPKYIWQDWNGNNTGSNNVSSQFVKYPATKSGMWFSYMEDGDDYVIVNSKELSGSAGLSATINYSVSPANVPGGAWDRMYAEQDLPYVDREVPVEFTVDSDGDGVLEVDQNKTLHAEMHHILGEAAHMSYYDISYTAPSGTSMYGKEDADQYFYVRWCVYRENCNSLQAVSGIYKVDGYSDGQDISTPEIGTSFNSGSFYYLWTKHPIGLLLNASSEGVKVSNYGTVYATFQSGYHVNIPVSSSTTVYMPKYPTGRYTKKQDSSSSSSSYTINGGQEDILDDGKEVKMPYFITWNGEAPVDPVWNEDKGTYEVPKYTMTFEDGLPGDVLYSSGSVPAKYVWEPSCGNVMLEDEDYYFNNIRLALNGYDAEKENGIWKEKLSETYVPVRFYARRQGDDDYDLVYSGNVCSTKNSVFQVDTSAKDIVGFKLEVDSAFYREDVSLRADLMLKPTNHVKQLLQADVDQKASSIIKNGARCVAYLTALGDTEEGRFFYAYDNTGGSNAANKNCYELNVSRTTQYTVKYAGSQGKTIFDVERGTQDTPMAIMAYNYNNSTRKKKMTTGTFYDLLPAGTSVDPVTVFGRLGNLNSSSGLSANLYDSYKENRDNLYVDESLYNVSFIHNYRDSGRTMMVIDYTAPEDGRIFTGIYFWYLLHNTYENVMEHGTNVENDVAFVNRTPGRVPPYSKSSALSTITEKQYFQSLEDAYSADISYARANTNYIPVDAVSWGFDKTVQTVSEYLHADQCLLNDQYRYKLTYSQSAYADSSSLVFFDVLENGAEVKGEDGSLQQLESAWHGTLEYVDVSSAANKLTKDSITVHCAPVIYYSTKPRDQFTGADYTLDNTATWSNVKPADLSTVTAIAVDCRKNTDGTDFVMHGQESLEIIVHMRAPKDSAYAGRAAYNTGIVRASHDGAEPTDQYSDAEVTLKEEDPELHKTSDPASGTQTKPADVFQDDVLTYTLSVSNHGELTAKDIVLSDVIPEGLSLRTEEVTVHFGDPSKAVAATISPRLWFVRDGQALNFTVRTLLPGETAYIEIPCTVLVTEGVLENTAHITSINGVEKEIDSEITWHEAQPATMAVFKKGYGDTGVVGAKMQLIAEDGTIAHEWVTDGRTESFIVPAGTYTAHEVEAPAGYFPAEDIEVVLDRQGYRYVNGEKVGAVEMQDDYTKVSVLKQDEEGNPLPGAVLAVYEIPEGYTEDGIGEDPMVSVVWLDGYSSVPIQGMQVKRSFVSAAGLMDYHPESAPSKPGYAFAYWDDPQWVDDTHVTVSAVWKDVSPDLPDVPDPVPSGPDPGPVPDLSEDIQAASYAASRMTMQSGPVLTGIAADAAAGKLGEPVKRWTSTMEAEPLYGLLEQGKEYVLVEESVPSSDYRLAEPVRFTVNADGSEQIITMTDPYDGYTFDVYKYGGSKGNPLAGAKLSIYPKGMGSAEENIGDVDMPDDTEGKDVSGRMSMEGGTEQADSQFPIAWTSGEGPQKIRLKAGTYILHEEEAPEGYRKHADIQFTVLQNGKVMYDQEGFIEDSIYMIDEPNTVDVSVVKQVEGNMGSKSKAFDFTLRLWKDGASGESLTVPCTRDGKAEEVTAVYNADSGCYVYDFKLRHGEQVLFGLPYGWAYRIGEEHVLRSGYQVTIDGPSRADIGYKAADDIADASVEALAAEPSSYVFTNTRNMGVATGFSAMTGVTVAMGILSICAVAVLAFLRYRKKQKPAA